MLAPPSSSGRQPAACTYVFGARFRHAKWKMPQLCSCSLWRLHPAILGGDLQHSLAALAPAAQHFSLSTGLGTLPLLLAIVPEPQGVSGVVQWWPLLPPVLLDNQLWHMSSSTDANWT